MDPGRQANPPWGHLWDQCSTWEQRARLRGSWARRCRLHSGYGHDLGSFGHAQLLECEFCLPAGRLGCGTGRPGCQDHLLGTPCRTRR